MQNERYKRSKWFIGTAVLVLAYVLYVYSAIGQGYTYAILNVYFAGFAFIGVLGAWLADYLLYKKFTRDSMGKPSTIDLNFKLKRNLVLLGVAICIFIFWLSNL